MQEDKLYCMSSFLMLRKIADRNKTFKLGLIPKFFEPNYCRKSVKNSFDLETILREQIENDTKDGSAALALSGGIDSAILAKFMPKGSVAYTFQCRVPGVSVVDEVPQAALYAKECGLEHRVIEIEWEDFLKYTPTLMKEKNAPIHSIEVQIYKAACKAKEDGFNTLIFGESADANYGGHDGLMAKDWTVEEFIRRYSYLKPEKILTNGYTIEEPFFKYAIDGKIDAHEFMRNEYYLESMGSYQNACDLAKINLSAPYSHSYMTDKLDYAKIRSGNSKYLVREVFKRLYPGWSIPKKIPMPRPMNEWLKDWSGPKRKEFISQCTDDLTGDQKWLIWTLESFLNILDQD